MNYYYNDIANDAFFPHSTVVEGWRADTVRLQAGGKLIHRQPQQIQQSMQAFSDRHQNQTLTDWLRQHSATFHFLTSFKILKIKVVVFQDRLRSHSRKHCRMSLRIFRAHVNREVVMQPGLCEIRTQLLQERE